MSDGNRKPDDFNWVSVRGKCSIRQMFEELKLGIAQDVEEMNKQTHPLGEPRNFKTAMDAKVAKVFEDDPFRDRCPSILFVLAENVIKVKDGETNQLLFDISISLNDEGDCRFTVGGKERDSWQIRRTALEKLFYPA